MSIHIGPGISYLSRNNLKCGSCPVVNNKKVLLTSANDSVGETQTQRHVNIIRNSLGGRTQFGNTNSNNYNSSSQQNSEILASTAFLTSTAFLASSAASIRNRF